MEGTRTYEMFGDITPEVGERFIATVNAWKAEEGSNLKVELFINSCGGDISTAFGLYDFIRMSMCIINTICVGQVCSAALVVFLAGKNRYITDNSFLLYHAIGWAKEGSLSEHKDYVEVSEIMQSMYDNIVTSNSKLRQKQLTIAVEKSKNLTLFAKDAIKLELAERYWGDYEK